MVQMYGTQLPPRYRPLPLPLPWPAVKREPLRYYRPESLPMPAVKREPDLYLGFGLGQQLRIYVSGFAIVAGVVMILFFLLEAALTPEPRLFVRFVKAKGLDVCEARDQSPLFELAVDVDTIPEEGVLRPEPVIHVGGRDGGGDHMLRVSYRGVVLAWGAVPRFTIRHSQLGRRAAGVVTVVTTAQGSVLKEDMRQLIRAERQAFGRVEFEADGHIPGLGGHLHCRFYLADEDKPLEGLPPCLVQKKTN